MLFALINSMEGVTLCLIQIVVLVWTSLQQLSFTNPFKRLLCWLLTPFPMFSTDKFSSYWWKQGLKREIWGKEKKKCCHLPRSQEMSTSGCSTWGCGSEVDLKTWETARSFSTTELHLTVTISITHIINVLTAHGITFQSIFLSHIKHKKKIGGNKLKNAM